MTYVIIFQNPTHFGASSYRFKDITISNFFNIQKSRSRSRIAIFSNKPLDGKCHNLQMSLTYFCANFFRFGYIYYFNFWSTKSRSRSRSAIFAVTPFDCICQNLQTSFLHFFILAKVRPVWTIVTVRQTQTRTHTDTEQAPGYRGNLADLPKSAS